MARVLALVARLALLLTLLASIAAAEPITLPNTKATITLGPEWRAVAATGVVAGYRTERGLILAITRAQLPNPDAWRTKKRDAYVDQIERGLAASIAGYRRLGKRLGDVNGVPVLDVEAKRKDGATIVVRILLFRTYALSLAIEVPRKGDVAAARAVATTFTPPPPL